MIAGRSPEPPAGGRTVLVVDDHADVREMVAAVLELAGCEVRTAADAGTAAEIAADGGVDLVLTDLRLEASDGVELAGQLRADRPDLPVILTSGFVRPGELTDVDHVLPKPFGVADLLAAVREATGWEWLRPGTRGDAR